jgi:hypothetical protein
MLLMPPFFSVLKSLAITRSMVEYNIVTSCLTFHISLFIIQRVAISKDLFLVFIMYSAEQIHSLSFQCKVVSSHVSFRQ